MSTSKTLTFLRWSARLGSIASIGLLSLFLFGGQEDLPGAMSTREVIGFAFFPVGIVLGMMLGWWREGWGGVIATVSLIGFYVWHVWSAGRIPAGPYFLIFALPGILFLMVAMISSSQRIASRADQ